MAQLWRLSAGALAEGYRSGAFTPRDAIAACLERITHSQPLVNAWAMVDAAGASQAADDSARRWAAGSPLGPLDGVPLALKDNLHAAGLPTGWGSRLLNGFVAEADELPVARLRAAGAVIVGKTTLPEFAMQGYTSSLATGTTRNPWDLSLTPGGSSGGAVAAVASGCVPLALATDGGGSIRRPASHTGLVGFKPSADLVERHGGVPDLFLGFEVAGPIARTVQDALALTQVLAGRDLAAPPVRPARILYLPRFADHPVDGAIAALIEQAAGQLRALGHEVVRGEPFQLAEAVNRLWPRLSAAGLAWMMAHAPGWPEFQGRAPDPAGCTPAAQATLMEGGAMMAPDLFELFAAVHALRQALKPLFEQHDFLLTPCTAALPWPAGQAFPGHIGGRAVGPRGHAVFTALANAAGLPAIALPCGAAAGLPTGLQLVGRAGADAALLALAQQFETAHPWASHWPEL